MVQSDQTLLYIGACTHLLGRTQKDTDLPGTNLAKQLLLLRFRIGRVDVVDLFFRDPFGDQLRAYIVIDIEAAITVGRGQITENKLCGSGIGMLLPNVIDRVGAGDGLAGLAVA